eukprot:CAMPEP_0116548968 /NCGR_PEP_ID=MMETSP0397-20121206/4622_1 /TAXON_ID=216820 /ORGANISM="Cyclophora tenuis, Strain ECT3854" /LENGTH=458 /DNA_ID=CAMNT_0004073659 /DNA_START=115 /DNA_END=1491 /DNA_ORIENTATION=+
MGIVKTGQTKNSDDQHIQTTREEVVSSATALNPAVRHETSDSVSEKPVQPVIHLASYEDRDRGERNAGSGPRMLYDPKSGSMVAVTPRDENMKTKRGKQKGRHETGSPRRSPKTDSVEGSSGRAGKKGKNRKEDTPTKRERRRGASADLGSPSREDAKRKYRGGKIKASDNRLPRTRGVLYARDEKGNCYCADGCDGDQGYGSHSVRGGRLRNPIEHKKLLEQQTLVDQNGYMNGVNNGYSMAYSDDHKASAKPEDQQPKIDWVKPNEKIELLTGAPESPTLQATAAPWAPSEAALAAAAAAIDVHEPSGGNSVSQGDNDGSENQTESVGRSDEEDTNSFIGLGFDPTENMDSVMRSPSMRAETTKLDEVELAALALDAAADGKSKSIFAFGSSTTWGTSGEDDSDSNWRGVLGSASRTSKVPGVTDVAPSAFLSFPSSNTWGTTGFAGLAEPGNAAD